MSQPKPTDLPVDTVTEKIPESKLESKPKSSQTGYESVYGPSRRQSASRRRIGYCEDVRRNNPQSLSLAAAMAIFISGGMNLVPSIGFGLYNYLGTHLQYSWFIAVIIGACISATLVKRLSKRVLNLVASVLVIISGIFFITATQSTSTIISARYCNGIAFGLTLIPTILAGCEQSVKRFRGMVLSVEQIGLTAGAVVILIFRKNWEDNSGANVVHGGLTLFFGLLALIFTFVFTMESPVFLLLKDFEDEAIMVLRDLQRPAVITHETYALLNETKALLKEDMNRERSKNTANSWVPMFKTIILRCFVSLSISYPLTMTFLSAGSLTSRSGFPVSTYVYMFMRLIGTTFSMAFLDTVGRRIPSTLSLFFGGLILFTVGCFTSIFWQPSTNVQPVVFLMLFYQLLSGIVAATSTCYLSEAFSVSVKPYFILASIIAENLLQVFVCAALPVKWISNFSCVLGGSQVVYAVFYFFTMPETMQTTLREALRSFKKVVVIKTNFDEDDEEVGADEV